MKKVTKSEKDLIAKAVTYLFEKRRREVQKLVRDASTLTPAQRRNLGPVGMYFLALLEKKESSASRKKK